MNAMNEAQQLLLKKLSSSCTYHLVFICKSNFLGLITKFNWDSHIVLILKIKKNIILQKILEKFILIV